MRLTKLRSPEQSCACDAGACVGAGTGGLIGGLVADDVEGGVVEGRGVVGAAVDGGVAAVGAAVGAAVDGALVTAVGARVSQMLSGQFTRWPPGSSRANCGSRPEVAPQFWTQHRIASRNQHPMPMVTKQGMPQSPHSPSTGTAQSQLTTATSERRASRAPSQPLQRSRRRAP